MKALTAAILQKTFAQLFYIVKLKTATTTKISPSLSVTFSYVSKGNQKCYCSESEFLLDREMQSKIRSLLSIQS